MSKRNRKIDLNVISEIAFLLSAGISAYYLISNFMLGDKQSQETKRKAKTTLQRLQQSNPSLDLQLSDYEKTILANVVTPGEMKVSFNDIGGLEDIIEELRESVLYPLTVPQLYSHHSSLLSAPKGVLLYGPPGCGKTMIAKACAKESGANFISIRMSSIMDKWFGESNKLVSAIFSLAQKLQPCIIFVDEMDSFLRERQAADHEVTAMLKAEFMTLWDGLTSDGRILVLGATNRPNDIDNAILRRMPKRFAVKLPDAFQRRKILNVLLKEANLDPKFDLEMVVSRSAGMSGSDLKEICRNAAMNATREYIHQNFVDGKKITGDEVNVRPLRTTDFFVKLASEGMTSGNRIREIPEVTVD